MNLRSRVFYSATDATTCDHVRTHRRTCLDIRNMYMYLAEESVPAIFFSETKNTPATRSRASEKRGTIFEKSCPPLPRIFRSELRYPSLRSPRATLGTDLLRSIFSYVETTVRQVDITCHPPNRQSSRSLFLPRARPRTLLVGTFDDLKSRATAHA